MERTLPMLELEEFEDYEIAQARMELIADLRASEASVINEASYITLEESRRRLGVLRT